MTADLPGAQTPESILVAAGRDDSPGASLNPPIVTASNFILGEDAVYARGDGTATWEALEDLCGRMECGHAVAFASGMAAVSAVFDQLTAGAHVVLPEGCYQGVTLLADDGARKGFWTTERLAVTDTAAWVEAAARADLIWLESPSNPLLEVADLMTICGAPRQHGALLVVDNTFATALNQQPLNLGADLSLQSATKFIGGHSDLLAGVITTRRDDLNDALRATRARTGATPGALEAFLALRGARTMALRVQRAQASAQVLAERLLQHPSVTCVRYPGLPSHPTHAIAAAQLGGFGTMIAFDLNGGAEDADAVCRHVRLIRHATSLGAVESTLERRAAVPGQEHLPPGLLRLSVGIEHVDELWHDLEQAISTVR